MKEKLVAKLDAKTRELVSRAQKVQERAYAPYSKFLVGCALEDAKGTIFDGCNVENASYGGATCAERTAIVKMVSEGSQEIKKIVVVTSAKVPVFPCGICLQLISEFGKNATVYAIVKGGKKVHEAPFSELYPFSFRSNRLKEV